MRNALPFVALFALSLAGAAYTSRADGVADGGAISPQAYEAIKATVIDESPSQFTIDVHKLSNAGVNEEAKMFAVYVADSLPARCGDFRSLELPYDKPEEYTRRFNLGDHKDVLDAIDKYGCIVLPNIPAE